MDLSKELSIRLNENFSHGRWQEYTKLLDDLLAEDHDFWSVKKKLIDHGYDTKENEILLNCLSMLINQIHEMVDSEVA
jgi:hypothetical protein